MWKRQKIPKYNLDLAIKARIVLFMEVHPLERCRELVYQPTQIFLNELAKSKPKKIVLLRTKPVTRKENGSFSLLDMMGLNNRVAHLGKVVNNKRAMHEWELLLHINAINPYLLKVLHEKGFLALIRERMHCLIPVDVDQLDLPAMEKAARKFLSAFAFSLVGLPIEWLAEDEQERVERMIHKQARAKARHATFEEKVKVAREDIGKRLKEDLDMLGLDMNN